MTASAVLPAPRRWQKVRLATRVAGLALFVALAAGWLVFLRPNTLGGPASYLIVVGVSMEPHLHTGDLVIVRQADTYAVGDVVAYPVPEGEPGAGSVVIHRIVGGSGEAGFVIQGDNKDQPDPWRPTAAEVIGRSWLELPGSGRFLIALRSPLVLAVILGLTTAWVAYGVLGRRPASPSSASATHGREGRR